METTNSTKKGKAIEHLIIFELLKHDFDIFVPIVDNGTDIIIKDREGGFVEIQVKSRNIRNGNDSFSIKDFTPSYNFFIVCHNIQNGDFYCVPSKKFHEKSSFDEEVSRRLLTFDNLTKLSWCKKEKGISLLKKALESKENRISGYLDKENE